MEKYIAFLRGVNISGKNKILMSQLKKQMEENKYENVLTILNSGNVIFSSEILDTEKLKNDIKLLIKQNYNLEIPVYVISCFELEEILNHSPIWWGTENKEIYDNLIFVIPPAMIEEVTDSLGKINDEFEKVFIFKSVIFWSFDLKFYRKTNWWSKTASSNIRNDITIRTANTVRKILKTAKNRN